MPALSSSNRSQLAYKLEGTYPTDYGVLQAGNGTNLNMTSETLDYTVKTESSKALRNDRAVPDLVPVGASSQGGFAFEHMYKEYDAFIEGVLQQVFTVYGTDGVSDPFTGSLTLATGSITNSVAPTGADAHSGLKKGQWFVVIPPSGASQAVKDWFAAHPLRVSLATAPTTTVITLDAATPIDTAVTTGSMGTGAAIGSSRAANGNTMKSYSLEVGHADVSVFRQYLGMIPSKMDLSLKVGAIVTGMFDFLGKRMKGSAAGESIPTTTGMETAVASQTFTPANAVTGVFDILEGGASITASTFIKSADLSIDNSLRVQDAVGVFGAAGIAAGTMNITGKVEVYLASTAMYEKLLKNTTSSLCVPVLDVAGNGYVYYFPRIKYAAAKVNAQGQDQDNMLSMDFRALPDITVGSDTLGAQVVIYRVGVAV